MGKLIMFTTFLVLFISSSAAAAADILNTGEVLVDGHSLVSSGGSFVLGFFSPANSNKRYVGIWYGKVSAFTVVWVANRRTPITAQSTGFLKLTSAGSLLISDRSSTVLWSSTTVASPADSFVAAAPAGSSVAAAPAGSSVAAAPAGSSVAFVAQLLDSGNLVVRRKDSVVSGEFIWQSFDYPTDTLLPGMKLGLDLTSGKSRSLTCWANPSDPSTGKYTMAIDVEGVPQLIIKSEWAMVWRSGPWNGAGFVGAESDLNYDDAAAAGYIPNYQANQDEISYSYENVGGAVTRVVIGSDGNESRLIWSASHDRWVVLWSNPNDACDRRYACGASSVCHFSDSHLSCPCLPGFEPTGACLRSKALSCGDADGFEVVNGAKLPDTTAATLEGELDLESCRDRCLRNCSCTAYAGANVRKGGSGCITWSSELTDIRVFTNGGQDLYVRLAAADSGNKFYLKLGDQ